MRMAGTKSTDLEIQYSQTPVYPSFAILSNSKSRRVAQTFYSQISSSLL